MKTYTVKQISEILKTNPETVRRWIRSGKLESKECKATKDGHVVSENAFKKFLEKMPKYAGLASAGLIASGLSSGTGAVALGTGIASGVLPAMGAVAGTIALVDMASTLISKAKSNIKNIDSKSSKKELEKEISIKEKEIEALIKELNKKKEK